MKHTFALLILSLALALSCIFGHNVMAAAAISQWLPDASGNWTTASNWSTNPFYPDNGSPTAADQYNVLIDRTGTPYTVTLNTDVTVSSVKLDSPDATLSMLGHLTTNSFDVTRGAVTIGDATHDSHLMVFDDITLNGTSIRLFGNSDISQYAAIEFRDTVTPQAIKGQGTIAFVDGRQSTIRAFNELTVGPDILVESASGDHKFQNGRLINEGLIRSQANSALDLLVTDLVNKGTIEVSGFTMIGRDSTAIWNNAGTIRIKPGGALTLFGKFTTDNLGTLIDEGATRVWLAGVLDNTGRILDVNSLGLTVPLQLNGGEIRGGVITTSGSGTIAFIPGIDARLNGVTLATNITVAGSAGGARVFINNGLTLDHTVLTLQEGAWLGFDGNPQVLGGTGTILASNLSLTSAITSMGGGNLTIGNGITIRDGIVAQREVQIGFQENRGTIICEAPNTIMTIGPDSPWQNNGVIRVTNGSLQFTGTYNVDNIGTLDYQGGEVVLLGTVQNTGKTILQNPSTGVWKLRGTTTGGRLAASGGTTADIGGIVDSLTIAGPAIVGGQTGVLSGNVTIRNQLTLDHASIVVPSGREMDISEQSILIGGTGEIVLDGATSTTLIQTFSATNLTVGPNVVVHTGPNGGGTISRFNLPVTNQGTISAETKDKVLVVSGALTNTGLLKASNGSQLRLDTASWTNQGQMNVDGGKITVTGTSFTNGASGLISGRGDFELTRSSLLNSGTISPGLPLGPLNIKGGLTMQPTSSTQIELGGIGPNDFDSITVSLNSSLGGRLDVSLMNGFHLSLNRTFLILNTAGTSTGQFIGLGEGARVGTYDNIDLFITYAGGNGNDVALFTVPESATVGSAFVAGAIAFSAVRRRALRSRK